jgi:hypothetical protein
VGVNEAVAPPQDDEEPTPAWTAATLKISLEDADWLLLRYRFAQPLDFVEASFRRTYFCEPL